MYPRGLQKQLPDISSVNNPPLKQLQIALKASIFCHTVQADEKQNGIAIHPSNTSLAQE